MQGVEEVRAILREEEVGDDNRITSLAALVKVAIEDGRAILKDDDVVPYSANWLILAPVSEEPYQMCYACFAGMMLLATRDGDIANLTLGNGLMPSNFPPHVADAMNALECIRHDNIVGAYGYLGLVPEWGERDEEHERRRQWERTAVKQTRVSNPWRDFKSRPHFRRFLRGMDELVEKLEAFEAEWL